jgi:hypothetical protein
MTINGDATQKVIRITDHEITCNQCGHIIGRIVEIYGQEWLQVGSEASGVIARSCHGVCAACSAVFNWHIADQMLSELVQKVLQIRKSMIQLEQKIE